MADAESQETAVDDGSDTDMPGLEVAPAAAPEPPSSPHRSGLVSGPVPGTATMFLSELMDPELLAAFIKMAHELPGPLFPDEVPERKGGLSDLDTWSYENRVRRCPFDESVAGRLVTVEPKALPTRVDTPLPSEIPVPETRVAPHVPLDICALVERLIQEEQMLCRENQLSVDAREPDSPHP